MDNVWPQRPQFKSEINQLKKAKGWTLAQVAERLRSTEGTLHAYMYGKKTKPSLEYLQDAAALAGCSVSLFIDDPGAAPGGFDLSDRNPIDRYRAGRIIDYMNNPLLTEEDKDILFEDYIRDASRRIASNGKK